MPLNLGAFFYFYPENGYKILMLRRTVVKNLLIASAAPAFAGTAVGSQNAKNRQIASNVEVVGQYRWVVYQVVDNPTDEVSPLVVKVKKTNRISVVDFFKSVASEKKAFTFEGNVSFGIKTQTVEKGGSAKFTVHREVFSQLEKSKTTTVVDETVTEVTQTFTLPPNYSGEIYRLQYEMGGITVKTDILSLTRREDIKIEALIDIESRLPGFTKLANKLGSIVPKSDNRGEWKEIRTSIVRHSAKPNTEQFEELLKTFSGITPKRDNRGEWSVIRDECKAIMSALSEGNYYPFFVRFVRLLSGIKPLHDNKGEWSEIRATSYEILSGIEEV